MSSVLGGNCVFRLNALFCWIWSTIGDVREGSDEEHSTWSGGKKIFDLLRCGWREKKMRKREKEKEKLKC